MHTSTDGSPRGTNEQDEDYQRARQRVGQIRGFYSNLFSYLVIVAFLAIVNLLTDRTYFWFLWVAAGWGVAVAFHAYATFANRGLFGREWEERKIREIIERERSERASSERASSERASSERASSERASSERASAERPSRS